MVHNLLKFLKNLRTNQSHLFDWNRKQLNDSNSLLETKAPSPNQEILEKQKNRRKYCRNHNNSFEMKSLKWFNRSTYVVFILLHVGFMLRISKSWFHELLCRQTARFKFMRDFQAFFILVRSQNLESPLWSEPCTTLVRGSLMLGSCWEMTVH